MDRGLLWYDDNPARDLADKVSRAARRYSEKFGTVPDMCYVHPSALDGNGKTPKVQVPEVGEVQVASRSFVLPGHFQVGIESRQ